MAAAERSAEADFPVSGSRGRFLLHGRSADNAAVLLPREWRIVSPAVAFDGGTAASAESNAGRRLGRLRSSNVAAVRCSRSGGSRNATGRPELHGSEAPHGPFFVVVSPLFGVRMAAANRGAKRARLRVLKARELKTIASPNARPSGLQNWPIKNEHIIWK